MKKKTLSILLSLICLNLSSQDFKWVHVTEETLPYSNSTNAIGLAIATDVMGNVYTAGRFEGSVDFDPGPLNSYTNNAPKSYYITKTDSSGNFLWSRQFNGALFSSSYSYFVDFSSNEFRDNIVNKLSMVVDSAGNIYLAGPFYGLVDFDPGPGTQYMSGDSRRAFILKLSASGNLIWKRYFISDVEVTAESIGLDTAQNLYVTGHYIGNTIFNTQTSGMSLNAGSYLAKFNSNSAFLYVKYIPSSLNTGARLNIDSQNNVLITSWFNDAQQILKLNSSGDTIWTKKITGDWENNMVLTSAIDKYGSYFIAGFYRTDSVDFDPGPGAYYLPKPILCDMFIAKFDSLGNFVWAKAMGGPRVDICNSITTDTAGNVYMTGYFIDDVDFDGSLGITNFHSPSSNTFIDKLDSEGNLIWARQIAGQRVNKGYGIHADAHENIYVTGCFLGKTDFDPGLDTFNLSGSLQSYHLKLSKNACAGLTNRIDSVKEMNCSNAFGYISSTALHGSSPYTYSWNTSPVTTSSVVNFSAGGILELTVHDANNCVHTTSVSVNAPSTITGFDLNANIVSTSFRTSFPSYIWLDAFNNGCLPVSGELKLLLDTKLIYDSSDPLPNSISGDTLIWNFVNMTYDAHFKYQISVTPDLNAVIGDSITLISIITPITADADTTNNIKKYTKPVINSYDPNEKEVSPKGKCTEAYILNDQVLTYTIRFQNTGNADAINVVVLDDLDNDLNSSTLKIVTSSHPVYAEIVENNSVRFNFKNIHLADSTTNEKESHGYVIFEIMPKPSLSPGITIKNKAGIYFDFNQPIITNEVNNTITDDIDRNCNPVLQKYESSSLYPNPTTSSITIELADGSSYVEIFNLMGQKMAKIDTGNNKTLDVELNYNAGIYFVKIVSAVGRQTVFKVIKN